MFKTWFLFCSCKSYSPFKKKHLINCSPPFSLTKNLNGRQELLTKRPNCSLVHIQSTCRRQTKCDENERASL